MATSVAAWYRHDGEALSRLRKSLATGGYPHLHMVEAGDHVEAIGTVALGAGGRELTRFGIRVVMPNDYPRSLPTVYETENRIPKDARHHVESTGALCVGLPESIWLEYGDVDLLAFLDGPVRSYLVGVYEFEQGAPWPFGEWGHGDDGIGEFYAGHFGVTDRAANAQLVRAACRPQLTWSVLCPCRSGHMMRSCHGEKLLALKRRVPRAVLRKSAATLDRPATPTARGTSIANAGLRPGVGRRNRRGRT